MCQLNRKHSGSLDDIGVVSWINFLIESVTELRVVLESKMMTGPLLLEPVVDVCMYVCIYILYILHVYIFIALLNHIIDILF